MKRNSVQAQSRTTRLARLKAERRALSHRPDYRPLADKRWPRLCQEIEDLEESFISYQGREFDATVVNEIDGSLTITPNLMHEGHDRLFRTEDGTYYLHRELKILDVDGDTERHASGRTLVHRISLTTAALWALMRCCAYSRDLRDDMAAFLAGRRAWSTHRDRAEVVLLSAARPADDQQEEGR